jgi:FSR family fosmidomycin resistance protein-like MFS transporter
VQNNRQAIPNSTQGEIVAQDIENESFQTGRVITAATGHLIHDTYTAFLSPLLPLFITKLILSKTEAGLLSVFMQGPSILQPILGHQADRMDLRYLVILAPAVTATMMSAIGVAPNYLVLALFLMVAGLSSAGIHAIGPVIAGNLSGRNLGRGMGFWMVGGELGRTLGPVLIVTVVGYLSLDGTPWLMFGGWLASILLFLYLRDVPIRYSNAGQGLPWRTALKRMRPLMVPLAGILVVRAFMASALTTYLPTFLSEEGADLVFAGASLSVLEGAGVVGALLGGSLSDRLSRRLILFISMLVTPLLTFVFLSISGWAQITILPFLGVALLSTTPVIMAMVQESYPDNRALANGVYMATSFIIRAVVIVILGGLGDLFGLRQGFIISSVLMLLGIPIIRFLPGSNMKPEAR